MEKRPKLVVLCGFPCSGKTKIAKEVFSTNGFVILNSDKIREKMGYSFNPFSDVLSEEERCKFHEKEEIMLHTINLRKHQNILNGKNVVIDSCAIFKKTRDDLLFSLLADKYLIWLKVDERILLNRNRGIRKGFKESLRLLKEKYWQKPEAAANYKLLEYKNNTLKDYQRMVLDIKKELSLKN